MNRRERLASACLVLVVSLFPGPFPAIASAPRAACAGRWHRVSVEIDREFGYLTGVDSLSGSDAWAVGHSWNETTDRAPVRDVGVAIAGPLRRSETIEPAATAPIRGAKRSSPLLLHWDGASWSEVAADPIPGWSDLEGISMSSPTDVWAVGARPRDASVAPLIQHFNGTDWSVVPVPDIGAPSWLSAVHALSPTDVWAVGGWDDRRSQRGLLMHYDGIEWTVFPGPKTWDAWFEAVDGSGPGDVWTSGLANRISGRQSLYLQHFDGGAWTSTPTGGHDGGAEGSGLAAFAPSDAWVVGSIWGWRNFKPVAQHWDGSVWTDVPVPNPGERGSVLSDVGGSGGDDVWTVGGSYRDFRDGWQVPTAAGFMWDGSAWIPVDVPTPREMSYLASLSVTPDGARFAVGSAARRPLGSKVLIAHAC
ncbi:MAG: hypothetical protein WD004_02265 [Actinomycetota bacterium]